MLHPYTTEELVSQRRAAVHAEASHARLAGQIRPRARGDPAHARFAIAARTFVRQVRALIARTAQGPGICRIWSRPAQEQMRTPIG